MEKEGAHHEVAERLSRSEERFRLLVSAVVDYAIFMLDPDGIVTTWNEGAQRIKGYSADEIIGRHFSAFYTPEDQARGKPQRALSIAAREGHFQDEGWRIRMDGSRFWASVVITALRDETGKLRGYGKVTRASPPSGRSKSDCRNTPGRWPSSSTPRPSSSTSPRMSFASH
jgi:PAS domain S-box-containing protein